MLGSPLRSGKHPQTSFSPDRSSLPLSLQGAEYTAAKGKDGLYNFVGLVLGHHGATIQRLQRGSGAKIEIHSKDGNLNGDHPPLDDITLHALVQADSRVGAARAVEAWAGWAGNWCQKIYMGCMCFGMRGQGSGAVCCASGQSL